MRYAQIRDMDISNGQGIGCSIFLQGCSMYPHCKNCFNKSTWDFNGGYEWTDKETEQLFEILRKLYITRVSILGGEPLDQAKELQMLTNYNEIIIGRESKQEHEYYGTDFFIEIYNDWRE